MEKYLYFFSLLLLLSGCSNGGGDIMVDPPLPNTLNEARLGFFTKLSPVEADTTPLITPPPELFTIVKYGSAYGNIPAYISPLKTDGKKHPAVLWLPGGFNNCINWQAWISPGAGNDATAHAFRDAGFIMMVPSLRGGNANPGNLESGLGEVTDANNALDYLFARPDVDPTRVYLAGYDTGATLALLVAESTTRPRAVFSFGPVADYRAYGKDHITFDPDDMKEAALRAPVRWLSNLASPTFIFEGDVGSIEQLTILQDNCTNPLVHFKIVPKQNHISQVEVLTKMAADKILSDTTPQCEINFAHDFP